MEAPLNNGGWLDLGTVAPSQERRFVQVLLARYFQTAASVTPGEASTLVTFNIDCR